jgi:hypothetical protein
MIPDLIRLPEPAWARAGSPEIAACRGDKGFPRYPSGPHRVGVASSRSRGDREVRGTVTGR